MWMLWTRHEDILNPNDHNHSYHERSAQYQSKEEALAEAYEFYLHPNVTSFRLDDPAGKAVMNEEAIERWCEVEFTRREAVRREAEEP